MKYLVRNVFTKAYVAENGMFVLDIKKAQRYNGKESAVGTVSRMEKEFGKVFPFEVLEEN